MLKLIFLFLPQSPLSSPWPLNSNSNPSHPSSPLIPPRWTICQQPSSRYRCALCSPYTVFIQPRTAPAHPLYSPYIAPISPPSHRAAGAPYTASMWPPLSLDLAPKHPPSPYLTSPPPPTHTHTHPHPHPHTTPTPTPTPTPTTHHPPTHPHRRTQPPTTSETLVCPCEPWSGRCALYSPCVALI